MPDPKNKDILVSGQPVELWSVLPPSSRDSIGHAILCRAFFESRSVREGMERKEKKKGHEFRS